MTWKHDLMYQAVAEYYAEHGDLDIPLKYVRKDDL